MSLKNEYEVRIIPHQLTHTWLLHKHYLHRLPSISKAFGLYNSAKILVGVCTFGMPASNDLCEAICGAEYKSLVIELNRVVINDDLPKNSVSYFVGQSFKYLPNPSIIVSYSDTSVGHHGYIYQALNFIYTGLSEPNKDKVIVGMEDIHSRHNYDNGWGKFEFYYQERARKHRYVYFHADKRKLKELLANFKYERLPYPKGDNERYDASYKPTNQGVLL